MSRVPLPELPGRIPDSQSELRLAAIRREAAEKGAVAAQGVMPAGAPFPRATSQTGYYGVPLLKEPQWKPEVPLYFFVGGAAGASAVIANAAGWVGDDRELVRNARWMAAGGGALASALLIKDLGKPSRFLNMLRVFKPQSPMSMGAWILAAFSAHAAAAKFADLLEDRFGPTLPVRLIAGGAKAGSLLWGMPFSNYTGVLI